MPFARRVDLTPQRDAIRRYRCVVQQTLHLLRAVPDGIYASAYATPMLLYAAARAITLAAARSRYLLPDAARDYAARDAAARHVCHAARDVRARTVRHVV